MTVRHASCACGQLKVVTQGEPFRVSICHCLACQRRTGSAFGLQAMFRRDQVRSEGRSTSFARTAESGKRITFQFCPDCGASVHYTLERTPDVIGVAVGAFADPSFPAPDISYYEELRHAWVAIPGGAEHSD